MIYLRGKTWWIDYYEPGNGKRKRMRKPVGSSKKRAEEQLAKVKSMKAEDRYFDVLEKKKSSKIKFGEPLDRYIKDSKDKKYFQESEIYFMPILRAHFGDMALDKINYMAVEDFRNLRKKTRTQHGGERTKRTVNLELGILRHIFNKAIEWEMIDKNPVKKSIRYQKANSTRERTLTPAEIAKLIEACPPYLKPIVAMGIYTGLRKGDILNLEWRNVDLGRGLIVLVEAKTEKKRYIVLNPDLLTLLKSLPVKGAYVFPGKKRKPRTDVKKSFCRALKEAGIEQGEDRKTKVVFHTLRHSCVTLLHERGADRSAIQGFIGHASEKQTEDYTHLTEQFQRRVGDLLTGLVDVGKIVEIGHKLVTKQEIQENSSPASA